MATVAAPPAFHSSFATHNGFAAFHQSPYRAPAAVQHNPFGAFAPRHHSGAKSPSGAASWRHSESVDRTPIVARTTTPKYRRGGPSHSRTPSTSSEASSSSWRERSVSPAVATIELQPATEPKPKEPKVPVYNIADLLRLSASPLVGISAESQAVVDDLVAHHVWRRGPHSGAGRRRRNRGTSNQRSSSRSSTSRSSTSSTIDDSERSD
ncbi:hypothetical protein EDB86DRAFT_2320850 [Lactarius hatsudake]|nr:hypothetical protein EDB86DRAFT_2320850 [Lactarius hatsudake]